MFSLFSQFHFALPGGVVVLWAQSQDVLKEMGGGEGENDLVIVKLMCVKNGIMVV